MTMTIAGEIDETAAAVEEPAAPERSQFERIREYISGQIGAVRRVEQGQQSAEALVELAEGELGALKRELEAARLGPKSGR